MSDPHHLYLCLGSNIHPDVNLPKAVELLKLRGRVGAISSAWESIAVGAPGPNFLNACLELATPLSSIGFVEQVVRPIEATLGRERTSDKNASRPIDIDIILFDDQPLRLEYWEQAFMVVPLAELLPDYTHPLWGERLAHVSKQMRGKVWILPRPEIMSVNSPKRSTP